MKINERIAKERGMKPAIQAGFSRKMAAVWYRKTRNDYKTYANTYKKSTLQAIHDRGFLARSIDKYNLLDEKQCTYITDFEYIFLSPINNTFSKWLDDILTTNRILKKYRKYCREVYFSIIKRSGDTLIFRIGKEDREYVAKDIYKLVLEKKILELRPSFWLSKRKRYKLECIDGLLYINDSMKDINDLEKLIKGLKANYIVSEYLDFYYGKILNKKFEGYIKFYIANDYKNDGHILAGYVNLFWNDIIKSNSSGVEHSERHQKTLPIDLKEGCFDFYELQYIKNWKNIIADVKNIGRELNAINFFSISIAVKETGFKILSFSANPYLPEIEPTEELNDYLKLKFKLKRETLKLSSQDRIEAIKLSHFHKFVKKHCRAGIRPYMQRLWFDAVKDDFRHTRNSLFKKLWAWKRGFLSYRIAQYGLTEDNYRNFISDYDYYWLNRINNSYQIWINDKTTFRYILEPFKEYIPRYYFSIFKRNGETITKPMPDCPTNISAGMNGIFEILEHEGKLALKPSAGTHGDGFFCLSYDDGKYYVNDMEMNKDEIINLIHGFKVFYLVTEFINMNETLKKIYDKSVNSVRIMVINKHGFDPKIMQSYMRIGSLGSGYTDNVGYGGICVMINTNTGELYNPEQIVDHKFIPCDKHPDTAVKIEGTVPNWQIMCNKILDICRFMPELEYLGFDIAITNESFQIIEINIHQDLHKAATYGDEIIAYFNEKINYKKAIYGIE